MCLKHILCWSNNLNEDNLTVDNINDLTEEKILAANEFPVKELKKKDTKWSANRKISWITLQNEKDVRDIFRRQEIYQRSIIKSIKYIPNFFCQRNYNLEINCRLKEREEEFTKNPD